MPGTLETGLEWLVDAHGCAPARLRSQDALRAVFDRIVSEVGLRAVAPAVWHVFPGEAGITGVLLLAESHLTCHTFPEHGYAGFNLYCCRPRAEWPWEARLQEALQATHVSVRSLARGEVVPAMRSR